jgi:hypothetical protein
MNRKLLFLICLTFSLSGCMMTTQKPAQSQVQIRQAQTRAYDQLDYNETLRAVVATLLDLGFIIDEANVDLGTVTGQRHWGDATGITVSVRQKEPPRLIVRVNVRGTGSNPPYLRRRGYEDPQTYQDFFKALDKAMFLAQNQVN